MQEVTVNGITYQIALSREEAMELYPGKRICKYYEAEVGDIVVSDNGMYVPLLRMYEEQELFYTLNGRRTQRITPKRKTVYVFPKMKFKVYFRKNLSAPHKPFVYTTIKLDRWGQIHNIAQLTNKTLTVNKVYFAKLLFYGLPPEEAIHIVFPKAKNKYKRSKLWAFMTCPQVQNYLFNTLGYMNTLKQALEAKGVSNDTIAEQIAEFIADPKANVIMKKWALETATNVLSEEKGGIGSGNTFINFGENTSVKDRLLEKAQALGLPVQTTSQSIVEVKTS